MNRDHAEVYYRGMPLDPSGSGLPLRRHGDEMQRLPGGGYRALGRCDDTMNLGGVKVSSVEIERAVTEGMSDVVAAAAAVGVPAPGGGPEQLAIVLTLLPPERRSGAVPGTVELLEACQREVRARLNPLFKVSIVRIKSELPRTASNKVMRRLLRDELMSGGLRSKL
jgi:acyl-coenzyme A synthetase/AMP-(fatty) acid ligase